MLDESYISGDKNASGCVFMVTRTREFKHRTISGESCGKLQKQGSAFCPKHDLIWNEEESEGVKRAQKASRTKARKKLMEEMLEAPPFKAHNPKFEKLSTSAMDPKGR